MNSPGYLLLTTIALSTSTAFAGDAPGVRAILEKARTGIGREAAVGAVSGSMVVLTGSTTFLGMDATARVSFDAHGNYKTEIDGPVPFARGVTGGSAWCRDLGGEVHPLYFGELEPMLVEAALITGAWVDSPAFEFTLAPDPKTGEGDVLEFSLRDGQVRGTITLDPVTGRPTGARYGTGPDVRSVRLSGELMVEGAWFPGAAELGEPSGYAITQRFESARRLPADAEAFTPPPENKADRVFYASVPAGVEVKKVKSGHLLVRPKINGREAGWWFFDTGAGGAVIDPKLADSLGLERFGEIPVGGMGGTITMPMFRPRSVTLGPITYHDVVMTQVDLSGIGALLGEEIVGAIGYNLLHRCIVRIDAAAPSLSIHDPAAFDDSGLAWDKLYVYERHPCVQARFENRNGLFKIDTGAGNQTVMFHAPAVVRHRLLDRETTDAKAGGVGGFKSVKVGTLAWFELGGARRENVTAMFSLASDGASADPWTDGAIGGKLLEPFELVLDYAGERMALVKKR